MWALIDGDLAAYRASAATQASIDWGDGEAPSIHANPSEAIEAALHTIRLWVETADCNKVLVALSGHGNFRKAVLPTYKANRSGVARPVALQMVHQAIRDTFPTASVDGLEGDDILGLALTSPRLQGKAVCVSGDKDMRTLPGFHLNPARDRLPVWVSEAEANRFWMTQTLVGDACDNYRGCPKIGPVKAARLLEGWDGSDVLEGFSRVRGAFVALQKGHHPDLDYTALLEAQAVQQARVARILRHGDFDKATRRVRLWHPTTPEFLTV